MADISAKALRELQGALDNRIGQKAPTAATTQTATVTGAKDGDLWVTLDGATTPTPASSSVCAVSVGDRVTTITENGALTITGNVTAPATSQSAVESTVAPVADTASEALTSAVEALTAAVTAKQAAEAATSDAATAKAKAEEATTDAATAKTKATEAAASAATASTKATEAASSASSAATSAKTAASDAATAKTAASDAAASAKTAASDASAAKTSATNAATSATNAETSASSAATSAKTAASDAATASTKATEAATSASNAEESANNASKSASSAASDAASAKASAESAVSDASTAGIAASRAQAAAEAAETASSEAKTKADSAATDASTAATKATEAAASAAKTATKITTEYATGSSQTTAPTSGWSSETPTYVAGTYTWMRNVVTYGNGSTTTTSPVLVTGNTGAGFAWNLLPYSYTFGLSYPTDQTKNLWRYAGTNSTMTRTAVSISDPPPGCNQVTAAFQAVGAHPTTVPDGECIGMDGLSVFSKCKVGDWASFSAWARVVGGGDDCYFGINSYMTNHGSYAGYESFANNYYCKKLSSDGAWTRVEIQFQLDKSVKNNVYLGFITGTEKVTVQACAFKFETGSMATPWCTTQAETIGAKGEKGEKGDTGTDGASVSTVAVQYASGTSKTTAPTDGWQSDVPALAEGSYVWWRSVTTITAADGTESTDYGTPALYMALDGLASDVRTAQSTADTAKSTADAAATDVADTREWFWHDSQGAHVCNGTKDGASVSNSRFQTDITSMGLQVVDVDGGYVPVASFLATGATIGYESSTNVHITGQSIVFNEGSTSLGWVSEEKAYFEKMHASKRLILPGGLKVKDTPNGNIGFYL